MALAVQHTVINKATVLGDHANLGTLHTVTSLGDPALWNTH